MSSSLCARETKEASNCDGGQYIPSDSSRWKNLLKRAVSACFADLKSITGTFVKKTVSNEETRETCKLMPAPDAVLVIPPSKVDDFASSC